MRLVFASVFLVAFAISSFFLKQSLRATPKTEGALSLGKVIPDFTLSDTEGRSVRLSSAIQGKKVVLVNFWATWCAPCRIEMPAFEKLYRTWKDSGFLLIAICRDEDSAKIAEYLRRQKLTFPILLDPEGVVSRQLEVKALPTSFLIGANRHILERVEGFDPDLDEKIIGLLKSR